MGRNCVGSVMYHGIVIAAGLIRAGKRLGVAIPRLYVQVYRAW